MNYGLFMVVALLNSSINLEVVYIASHVTISPGLVHDSGIDLKGEDAATFDFGWGDYEAASYDGFSDDSVFFAGEHSYIDILAKCLSNEGGMVVVRM